MGTRYAGGNAAHGPLTDRGRDVVKALDHHGIIHDASHLSDDALDDLLDVATGPIVATHSNCRALMEPDNQRHLRDDQIKAITDRGGIIGLNLFTKFLARDRRATVDDCIAHIEHITQVAGRRNCVALGSDMDGGFGPESLPVGVDHPQKLRAISEALATRGWSDEDIAGFCHDNWLGLLRSAW